MWSDDTCDIQQNAFLPPYTPPFTYNIKSIFSSCLPLFLISRVLFHQPPAPSFIRRTFTSPQSSPLITFSSSGEMYFGRGIFSLHTFCLAFLFDHFYTVILEFTNISFVPGVPIILLSRGLVLILCWERQLESKHKTWVLSDFRIPPPTQTFLRCQTYVLLDSFRSYFPPNFWLYKLLWQVSSIFIHKVFISHTIHFPCIIHAKQACKTSVGQVQIQKWLLFFLQYWKELRFNNWTAQKEHSDKHVH